MQAGTMTGAAIKKMMRKTITEKYGGRFKNPNVKTVGIIITDGRSQDRRAATYWAKQARRNNITLYTIGIGSRVKTGGDIYVIFAEFCNVLLNSRFQHIPK